MRGTVWRGMWLIIYQRSRYVMGEGEGEGGTEREGLSGEGCGSLYIRDQGMLWGVRVRVVQNER